MGENEQGGMLRVVVVVGLIAIIAGVMIGSVVTLKSKMNTTSSHVQSSVDSAVISANDDTLGNSSSAGAQGDSLSAANTKAATAISIDKNKIDVTASGDGSKWIDYDIASNASQSLTVNPGAGPNGATTFKDGTTAGGSMYSPKVTVPGSASQVTASVDIKSTGQSSVELLDGKGDGIVYNFTTTDLGNGWMHYEASTNAVAQFQGSAQLEIEQASGTIEIANPTISFK